MKQNLQIRTNPETAFGDSVRLLAEVSSRLDIDPSRIKALKTIRRSIDARQRRIMVNLSVDVWIDETPESTSIAQPVEYKPLPSSAPTVVVVGAGPAGLFAALGLIEHGIRPIVLERGKDVDSRRIDVARISREDIVDPDSNYCFGEGGAGTFSDGKLYTRSTKRGNVSKILNIFHQHGADENVLIEQHPHIGSDRLPLIIKNIRNTIISCGGKVEFTSRVQALEIDDNQRVKSVKTAKNTYNCDAVVLAIGHSARDTYRMLHDLNIAMEPKGLAVGVRLEHPQKIIDQIRYHNPDGRGKFLPPAPYSLLTRIDNRAVYSFCMCPGGTIIPATSQPGLLVVNGMSSSSRSGRWANSGMVVEVLPEDVPGDGPLKMMDWQESIEQRFFEDSGSQNAPAQRMTDFIAARPSKSLPESSYPPGIHPARVDLLLPPEISSRLRRGLDDLGKKNRGFKTPEATVIGNETRTSSPLRLLRDPETLQSINVLGLYPCGEGAGYAGGIVSAAVDGDRVASSIATNIL